MSSTRAKGFMENWTPTAEVQRWIDLTNGILQEYRSYGPMTVRQVFYRLVGQHDYTKDERAYKRLAEYLVKARRAGMVSFGSIRDDGTVSHTRDENTDRRDVWEYITDIISRPADYLRLNRNNGQPHHVELWCEAAGMAPMLAQMVRYRDISVYSTGGFSSLTVTHEVASRIARRDKPTYLLHVGDYDPSGESIFTSMVQDIGSFVSSKISGGRWQPLTGMVEDDDGDLFFIPQRVALTEDQVDEFGLPTAPPKLSDSRSANWVGETTQAEAMPPTLLEQVVRGAVDELTDDAAFERVEEQERNDKERLRRAVEEQSVEDVIADNNLTDPSLLKLLESYVEIDIGGPER